MPSPGSKWHAQVISENNYICEAETHDRRCDGFPTEAHHVVFRWRLVKEAMWLRANGIGLSQYCHMLAHSSHNANLPAYRLDAAVRAVNAVQGEMPGQRIPPFYAKNL